MLRAPIQRQASVIAACRVMEVQRSKRRVRANADFPTNRWRPAGWSATDRVALGGSCWHCGRRAVHCATCRSDGKASIPPAAYPVKARHRRHSTRSFSPLVTYQMPGKYPPPTCAVEVDHTVKAARSALALSDAAISRLRRARSAPQKWPDRGSGAHQRRGQHLWRTWRTFMRRDETN